MFLSLPISLIYCIPFILVAFAVQAGGKSLHKACFSLFLYYFPSLRRGKPSKCDNIRPKTECMFEQVLNKSNVSDNDDDDDTKGAFCPLQSSSAALYFLEKESNI